MEDNYNIFVDNLYFIPQTKYSSGLCRFGEEFKGCRIFAFKWPWHPEFCMEASSSIYLHARKFSAKFRQFWICDIVGDRRTDDGHQISKAICVLILSFLQCDYTVLAVLCCFNNGWCRKHGEIEWRNGFHDTKKYDTVTQYALLIFLLRMLFIWTEFVWEWRVALF